MLPVTIPTDQDLTELTQHRDPASVSIYLESSPYPREIEKVRLNLKNLVADAEGQLRDSGLASERIRSVIAPVRALEEDLRPDDEFWMHQARGLVIFAAPDVLRTFQIPNRIKSQVAVGDRFDLGALLRSVTFPQGGYVLTVSEGGNHLWQLQQDSHPVELELSLPSDLHTVLEHADNSGQMDMPRSQGATGDRIERQRFCRIVQEEVLRQIGESPLPLILAASHDLAPVYRAINTHKHMLERGIEVNPEALNPAELGERAREVLDEHYREQLSQWKERFGTERSQGRATSRLKDVAYAATAAAVAELHFNMDDTSEGTIDENGIVHHAEPGPATYGLVDEIAVRVLATGGIVRAVRNEDLLDGSPVAAVLRYPLDETR